MTIQPGQPIPEATLFRRTDDGIRAVRSRDVFAGRRVILFSVPGAFTPTCSEAHLPGFVIHAAAIKAKVDAIVCVAVNDAHVMTAWGRANHADAIEMLADGNGELARAMGLTLDLSDIGLGVRSQRYAALVEDGVVRQLWVEPARGRVTVSGAEAVLAALAAASSGA